MAGLGRLQRGLGGLGVAELADQDHVGVLAQRAPERLRERTVSIPTSRWLTMLLSVGMQHLDRVLDRDDVLLPRAVDVVDHRGERRGLARAGRAGDEHEPAMLVGEAADAGRQWSVSKLGISLGITRQRDRDRAALPEGVDAEARAGALVADVELAGSMNERCRSGAAVAVILDYLLERSSVGESRDPVRVRSSRRGGRPAAARASGEGRWPRRNRTAQQFVEVHAAAIGCNPLPLEGFFGASISGFKERRFRAETELVTPSPRMIGASDAVDPVSPNGTTQTAVVDALMRALELRDYRRGKFGETREHAERSHAARGSSREQGRAGVASRRPFRVRLPVSTTSGCSPSRTAVLLKRTALTPGRAGRGSRASVARRADRRARSRRSTACARQVIGSPPRALGRQRATRVACAGSEIPLACAHLCGRRRVRRDDARAAVAPGAVVGARARGDRARRRDTIRSGADIEVPRGSRTRDVAELMSG